MSRIIGGRNYLTPPEAAKEVGISRWTLNRWLAENEKRSGKVKILKDKVSGRRYIAEDSLRALLRNRFQETSI
jgi:hypothetical protein